MIQAPDPAPEPLTPEQLRWRCDPESLGFTSTATLEPIPGVVGQDEAVDALRFGLEFHASGQNIYVRGLEGTGRLTMVRRLLEEIRPQAPAAPDHLYVHSFSHPDRPWLISVERGQGALFADKLGELRAFIVRELGPLLAGEAVVARRKQLEQQSLVEIQGLTQPLEAELKAAGLALVMRESGSVTQPLIMPLHEGKPVTPERFAELIEAGTVSPQQLEALEQGSAAARERVDEVFHEIAKINRRVRGELAGLIEAEAGRLLTQASAELRQRFPQPRVGEYLDALISDVLHHGLRKLDEIEERARLYEVNLLSCHGVDEPSPVIVETAPSMRALLGTIDAHTQASGEVRADHTSIRAGSLVRADGGVLVLEAAELLGHPGAWSAVVRTLRTGKVELLMPELPVLLPTPSLKPEPVPVDVKVVLLGDARLYYLLDEADADFPHLFKVLADFEETIPRTTEAVRLYAGVFARIA
ncbi:MAG: AAA family ATPase, partial [Myxococcales bacterium]|nr:AAA family ATPase [Myxococcales bacterium]